MLNKIKMTKIKYLLLVFCGIIFFNAKAQKNDKEYQHSLFSINIGGYVDVFRPDFYKIMALPRLSLQFGRVELGGFYWNTDVDNDNVLGFSSEENPNNINSFIKVYALRQRDLTFELGFSSYGNATLNNDILSVFEENHVTGVAHLVNKRVPYYTKDYNANLYLSVGYSVELFNNLYIEPQVKIRSGSVKKEQRKHELRALDGLLHPNDPEKINYFVETERIYFADYTLSLSLTYKFKM